MYLTAANGYYDRDGQQRARRAPFLILLQPKQATIAETCKAENTYAIVRSVALRQLGHWMMGVARVEGRSVSVSGAYGHDGLPCSFDFLPKDAVQLPKELYEAWAKGGGWNSSGTEGNLLRNWARETFKC